MYKGILDYVRKNMDGWHGDFVVAATDMSEKEEGAILVSIHPEGKANTANFIVYGDGHEELEA